MESGRALNALLSVSFMCARLLKMLKLAQLRELVDLYSTEIEALDKVAFLVKILAAMVAEAHNTPTKSGLCLNFNFFLPLKRLLLEAANYGGVL